MLTTQLFTRRRTALLTFALLLLLISQTLTAATAKNVILMITDGAGFNTYKCANFYQYGSPAAQPYDTFPVKLGCTTYALKKDRTPQGYDQKKAWSDFDYLKIATDSAAAATALNTGQKTRNRRIAIDKDGKKLKTFAQIVDSLGKATGVVTTVEISHATPAAVWAHNISRYNYEQIANEMIFDSGLDVIMGAGHPAFDNNAKPRDPKKYETKYLGGIDTFNILKNRDCDHKWKFIDARSEFLALANNNPPLPGRLIGVARCGETLQAERNGSEPGNLNKNVPDLSTMTKGALNVLNTDPDGFYLMIEAGAVDWANHDHNLPRAIEEMIDFNKAVQTVIDWVQKNSSWNETLLIVTSDHETGQLWGPNAGPEGTDQYQLPQNKGKGNYPSAKYFHSDHTNVLVPLFAIGPGSEKFAELIDGTDKKAATKWNFSGKYVDNTDIFTAMNNAIKN